MGGLSWAVHSLITIVFGHPNEEEDHHLNEGVMNYNKDNINNNKSSSYPKTTEDQYFQMPLHYPRYNKEDYEKMEEWKVDILLREYGLMNSFVQAGSCSTPTLDEKRSFAMGAFLWPDQM